MSKNVDDFQLAWDNILYSDLWYLGGCGEMGKKSLVFLRDGIYWQSEYLVTLTPWIVIK